MMFFYFKNKISACLFKIKQVNTCNFKKFILKSILSRFLSKWKNKHRQFQIFACIDIVKVAILLKQSPFFFDLLKYR